MIVPETTSASCTAVNTRLAWHLKYNALQLATWQHTSPGGAPSMNEDAISTVELISIQKDVTIVAGYKRKRIYRKENWDKKRGTQREPQPENVD